MVHSTQWQIGKKEVSSKHGLVACQSPKAARAGADVLARGGNAVDAAVAAAATLSVVEPWLSGLGGGGFMVYMGADGRDIRVLDFNMVSPAKLNPADYPLRDGDDGDWFSWPKVEGEKNLLGYSSIGVPGAVAGLGEALRTLGSISWSDALEAAQKEAEAGLEVDWFLALALAIDADKLALFPGSRELYLRDGRAPRVADNPNTLRLPMDAKAAMLRRLREAGPEDFYTGGIARKLVADMAAGGSTLDLDDLAAFRPEWLEPMRGSYRGWNLAVVPGLSAGPSLLRAMRTLETEQMGREPSAKSALAYARAIRASYEERLKTMGHAGIAPGMDSSPSGVDAGCTSNLCVVDARGTMVALTNTLLSRFGSKVVAPSLGLCMNNAMMWFDPRPGQPNSIAPAARPLANMCPMLLWREGGPRYAMGAAGGRTIFPTLVQIASYVADMGFSLEQAFTTPRIDAASPTIKVNVRAGDEAFAAVTSEFAAVRVEDAVYPVYFSVPTAVSRDAGGVNTGMAHHNSPWAAVEEGKQP